VGRLPNHTSIYCSLFNRISSTYSDCLRLWFTVSRLTSSALSNVHRSSYFTSPHHTLCQLISFYMNSVRRNSSQPRRIGSLHGARPDSSWRRPITAHWVQVKKWGRVRRDERCERSFVRVYIESVVVDICNSSSAHHHHRGQQHQQQAYRGYLRSPFYPEPYPATDADCVVNLTAPGSDILLQYKLQWSKIISSYLLTWFWIIGPRSLLLVWIYEHVFLHTAIWPMALPLWYLS